MDKFTKLTITSLRLGLRDLFDKRHADLILCNTGRYHEPELKEKLEAIEALPAALSGAPLSEELDTTDAEHDALGGYLYRVTELYEQLPGAVPDIVEAGRRIRAAFLPELTELSARYTQEAARAIDRKPQLAARKADLQLFPIPAAKGQKAATLYDVAAAFIGAGEKLDALLSQRGDATPQSRKSATTLRSSTIGLVNRVRADLAKETKRNPKLPDDLDQRIFGYFDVLERMQPDTARAATKEPASTPTPATPPASASGG